MREWPSVLQFRRTADGLRDDVLALRNRLLSSQRFQRWASRNPLLRRKARHEAEMAFDLCAGFVYSQVLFAVVQLELLEQLAIKPAPLAELATRCGLDHRAMATLLGAASALGLVRRCSDGHFTLGARGVAVASNKAIGAMVRHHALLYADLADPVALLRGRVASTHLSQYWCYASVQDPGALKTSDISAYSSLMASSQTLIADDIVESYPFANHRALLDVGGGEGVFVEAARRRAPGLRVGVYDLPAVVSRARERSTSPPWCAEISLYAGNFFRDPLPQGYDLVSLVRVAHDHDDDALPVLLRAIRAALPAGGTLLIAEPMSAAGPTRVADAYFGIYLHAMGSGRPRSADELGRFTTEAGFSAWHQYRTPRPMLACLIAATA